MPVFRPQMSWFALNPKIFSLLTEEERRQEIFTFKKRESENSDKLSPTILIIDSSFFLTVDNSLINCCSSSLLATANLTQASKKRESEVSFPPAGWIILSMRSCYMDCINT